MYLYIYRNTDIGINFIQLLENISYCNIYYKKIYFLFLYLIFFVNNKPKNNLKK